VNTGGTYLTAPTPSIVKEWERLGSVLNVSPFNTAGWIQRWQGAFGQGAFRVVVHRDRAGQLMGILPLQGRAGTLSSPTNWHTPEFEPLAATPQARDELLALAMKAGAVKLQLSFVDDATVAAVSEAATQSHRAVLSRTLARSPYIQLTGAFEDYVAGLDRHMRSGIRRRRRKLSERGPVRFEVHSRADEDALRAFLRVEASGWKARNGSAITREKNAEAFYRSIAAWAAEQGWLRLGLLRVGDSVVAGDLALEHGGHHYSLKTGYDEELRAFGPGKLVQLESIEKAFRDGLRSFEFLGTDEAWKVEWTQQVRERQRIDVFAAGFPGRAHRSAYARMRPLAKTMLEQAPRWRRPS